MQDATRTPPDATALSLSDAAVRLGISPDAARKRLERGTLRGVKNHGRWVVYLEPDAVVHEADAVSDATEDATRMLASNMLDDTSDTPGRQWTPSDAGSSGNHQEDQPGIVPLVELVTELTRRNDELARQNVEVATAAAIWQERARFLSERLAALEAGPTVAPASPESANASVTAQDALRRVDPPPVDDLTLQEAESEPVPTEISLATAWRRWWRRVMGHQG